jgi:hypothetical protein
LKRNNPQKKSKRNERKGGIEKKLTKEGRKKEMEGRKEGGKEGRRE